MAVFYVVTDNGMYVDVFQRRQPPLKQAYSDAKTGYDIFNAIKARSPVGILGGPYFYLQTRVDIRDGDDASTKAAREKMIKSLGEYSFGDSISYVHFKDLDPAEQARIRAQNPDIYPVVAVITDGQGRVKFKVLTYYIDP